MPTGSKSVTITIADSLATQFTALEALGADGGVSISHAEGVLGVVSAGSGATITAGAMRCFAYLPVSANADGSPATSRWARYALGDWNLDTGYRDAASGDNQAITALGRFAWLSDGITLSVGTTVTLTYSARRARK